MMRTVGILGVGHLAESLVEGLMSSTFAEDARAGRLWLSQRGEDLSGQLSAKHGLQRASDNQALVNASDLVLLATRPQQVEAALADLHFGTGKILVCVAAGVSLERLCKATNATTVVRAMPITAARVHHSPTAMYPDQPAARSLFELLGHVTALDSEAHFEIAATNAAMYGWLFALCDQLMDWNREQGLSPQQARAMVAGTFHAASTLLTEYPATTPAQFLHALATPGGITERGLQQLNARQALQAWPLACTTVRQRDRTTPTL